MVVVVVEELAIVEDRADSRAGGSSTDENRLEGNLGNDLLNLIDLRIAGINGIEGNSGSGLSDLKGRQVAAGG